MTKIKYYAYPGECVLCTVAGAPMCSLASSEVENIACSQPSTCLTCWLWCYSAQPCRRMTSVTHSSLSSLPLHSTLLQLTHWHKLCLTVLLCSLCFQLWVSFTFFTAFSPPGPLFCYHIAQRLSHICSCSSPLARKQSVSHSSAAFPRTTLVGFGGQQAMTVVLAVDCEVTFTHPYRDFTALPQLQKQRQGEMRGWWMESTETQTHVGHGSIKCTACGKRKPKKSRSWNSFLKKHLR